MRGVFLCGTSWLLSRLIEYLDFARLPLLVSLIEDIADCGCNDQDKDDCRDNYSDHGTRTCVVVLQAEQAKTFNFKVVVVNDPLRALRVLHNKSQLGDKRIGCCSEEPCQLLPVHHVDSSRLTLDDGFS